jgi:hypothetical protein
MERMLALEPYASSCMRSNAQPLLTYVAVIEKPSMSRGG